MDTLSIVEQALVITVIGIVSIFAVLFILWGLMAALVRITTPRQAQPAPAAVDSAAVAVAAPGADDALRRAAVVAVAVALALEAQERASAPPAQPAQGPISPWQATIRGNAMSRRAGVYRRNPPPQ